MVRHNTISPDTLPIVRFLQVMFFARKKCVLTAYNKTTTSPCSFTSELPRKDSYITHLTLYTIRLGKYVRWSLLQNYS